MGCRIVVCGIIWWFALLGAIVGEDPLKFLNSYEGFFRGNWKIYDFGTKVSRKLPVDIDENYLSSVTLTNNGGLNFYKNGRIYRTDHEFKILEEIKSGNRGADHISSDGQYVVVNYATDKRKKGKLLFVAYEVTENSQTIFIVEEGSDEEGSLPIADQYVFLNDNRSLVYKTQDGTLYKFEIDSKKKTAIGKIDPQIYFFDDCIAHHHNWILCSDNESIYIYDVDKQQLRTVKKYTPPGLPTFVKWTNNRPLLVSNFFLWRDDDKGFLFYKYNLSFWHYLNLPIYFTTHGVWPDELWYYDLEKDQEFFVGNDIEVVEWRKKR